MSEAQCKIEKCKRPYRAKGYCGVHYSQWRHGKLPHARYKSCHAEGCHKPMTASGLCTQHAGGPEAPKEAPKETPPVPPAAAETKAPPPADS